ncbi:hypothetical protein [Methylotenera versatilis]|uniref:hypothetical protein n=1 Tax=Methylotenera versatilis TaxID=1055487 RepID=UPI00064841F9|nr:hypothetical protein [Methylotenera versatilis]
MNRLQTLIAVTFISFTSAQVIAAPVDEGPPAQTQKDKVPEATDHGNYLEPQPVENSDAKQTGDKHHKKDNKNRPKGKNTTEQPKDGGVDVNQK